MYRFVIAAILGTLPISGNASSLQYLGPGPTYDSGGAISVSADPSVGDTDVLEITFDWDSIPDGGAASSADVRATSTFDLYVTGYADLTADLDAGFTLLVSAFNVAKIDGSAPEYVEGTINDVDNPGGCSFLGPTCFVIKGDGSAKTGTSAFDYLIDVGTLPSDTIPVITGLGPGTYRITAGDSVRPTSGPIVFELRAPSIIPLPASALLLLAGLGALGVAGRRRAG